SAWRLRQAGSKEAPAFQFNISTSLPFSTPPTCLALDSSSSSSDSLRLAIAFHCGSIALFTLQLAPKSETFYVDALIPSASPSSEVLAIAFSSPYLAALSKSQEFALFTTEAYPPKLIYTLRS